MSSFEHLPEDWADRLVQAPLMAAEIQRLRDENTALLGALTPFAEAAVAYSHRREKDTYTVLIPLGLLRRAAAALEGMTT